MSKDKRLSACILLINNGKILAVRTHKHKNKAGLPGGKLDKGETSKQAAVRETEEETGIKVSECHFLAAFKTDNGYFAYAYMADKWSGDLKSSSEGEAVWVTPQELIDGAFPEYNSKILEIAGVKDVSSKVGKKDN